MDHQINAALIYGSTREGRFADTIAAWASARIRRRGDFALDIIDPARLDLPVHHPGGDHPAVAALRQRIGRADAFVVVTPEYNHGYPAALKHTIDLVFEEWQAKPVAFVSYGGVSGGLRAVEQLRLVFAELHAVTIRDTVSFANPWNRFAADGTLADDGQAAEAAMARMLDQLRWWATALRTARQAWPYGAPAPRTGGAALTGLTVPVA